jgi:hypothetical protein
MSEIFISKTPLNYKSLYLYCKRFIKPLNKKKYNKKKKSAMCHKNIWLLSWILSFIIKKFFKIYPEKIEGVIL